MLLLVVSSREIDTSQPFYSYLGSHGKILLTLPVEKKISALLANEKIDAVIGFEDDLPLLKKIIARFPLVNYALVSEATPDDFHEMTEGYGFFYQVPEALQLNHAREFLDILETISISVAEQLHAEQVK